MRRPIPTILPLLLVALLGSACSSHSGSRSASSTSASSAASSTSAATTSASATTSAATTTSAAATTPAAGSASVVPGTTVGAAAPAPGARTTVTAIRIGPQDTFDRVVFELGGAGTPGYTVRYVDHPTSPASGKPESVPGEAVLQVSITGTALPADTGVHGYSGPDELATANTQAVTQVVYDGLFEGTTTAFIGTSAQTAFRAYLLTNPTRVVVDVSDPG